MAIQPDPYFAFPSLFGAPAYARPPCPAVMVERPLDADDLPLTTYQTEEERRLADALASCRGRVAADAGPGHALPGDGESGYRAPGLGSLDLPPEPLPRRLRLRELTERIRSRS